MAVKIRVKNHNEGDFELVGQDMIKDRILGESVGRVVDKDGVDLYIIPFRQIRFIHVMPDNSVEVPRSVGQKRGIAVHMEGDTNGDIKADCNHVNYDIDKFFDKFMVNLVTFTKFDDKGNVTESVRDVSIPFENVRYIDFNLPLEVGEGKKAPTSEKQKKTSQEKVGPKPTFRTKPRN